MDFGILTLKKIKFCPKKIKKKLEQKKLYRNQEINYNQSMKLKILVPEIDKEKWSKLFKEKYKELKKSPNDMKLFKIINISHQEINGIKNNNVLPNINAFLSICHFFSLAPDYCLFANPKWIECNAKIDIEDIPRERILGKFEDTYYIGPYYDPYPSRPEYFGFEKNRIKILLKEPDESSFDNFHLLEKFDFKVQNNGNKVIYKLPQVDDQKTSEKINAFLQQNNISDEILQTLLGYKQPESIRSFKKGKNPWPLHQLYKLSWILNTQIEELLVINYQENEYTIQNYQEENNKTKKIDDTPFDPIAFLEKYLAKNHDYDFE